MKEKSFYPIPARLRRMIKQLILVLGCLISLSLQASLTPCSGKMIHPATDICWDCLLPITLGGSTIKSGSNPDTSNPGSTFCRCPPDDWLAKPGVAIGYWEPVILDVVRTPYCLVSLGGVVAGSSLHTGDITVADPRENSSFFQVHAYNFPVMAFLGIVGDNCHAGGGFMPLYMSELDPTWADNTLSATLFPVKCIY